MTRWRDSRAPDFFHVCRDRMNFEFQVILTKDKGEDGVGGEKYELTVRPLL